MGKQTGIDLAAISVSRDHKWVVCGTMEGASVWDADLQEKVTEVEGTVYVDAVDISPDSTRFATGTGDSKANIWSITNGDRLVGPLEHDSSVRGIKFSPDGRHIATACNSKNSIRVFDSHNGDQLIVIENPLTNWDPMVPIDWSVDGQLFSMSTGGKIKSFDTSSGSQLAEWEIHEHGGNLMSIAISANGKFLASFAGHSVSFWDTSTHTQLGIVEVGHDIRSIALSLDGSQLVTGGYGASEAIVVWDLTAVLPETYCSINVSTIFSPRLGRLMTSTLESSV